MYLIFSLFKIIYTVFQDFLQEIVVIILTSPPIIWVLFSWGWNKAEFLNWNIQGLKMVILLSKLYGCQTVLHRWLILELKMLYVVIPNEKKNPIRKLKWNLGDTWKMENLQKMVKNKNYRRILIAKILVNSQQDRLLPSTLVKLQDM